MVTPMIRDINAHGANCQPGLNTITTLYCRCLYASRLFQTKTNIGEDTPLGGSHHEPVDPKLSCIRNITIAKPLP